MGKTRVASVHQASAEEIEAKRALRAEKKVQALVIGKSVDLSGISDESKNALARALSIAAVEDMRNPPLSETLTKVLDVLVTAACGKLMEPVDTPSSSSSISEQKKKAASKESNVGKPIAFPFELFPRKVCRNSTGNFKVNCIFQNIEALTNAFS